MTAYSKTRVSPFGVSIHPSRRLRQRATRCYTRNSSHEICNLPIEAELFTHTDSHGLNLASFGSSSGNPISDQPTEDSPSWMLEAMQVVNEPTHHINVELEGMTSVLAPQEEMGAPHELQCISPDFLGMSLFTLCSLISIADCF